MTTIGAAQAKNETDDKKPCFLKRWSSASIFVNHAHVTGFFYNNTGLAFSQMKIYFHCSAVLQNYCEIVC